MQVATLWPCVCGIVERADGLTAIVKATFALTGAQPGALLDRPEPLFWDDDAAGDELCRASDYAPAKERVDVLLSGSAHAPFPRDEWLIELSVDGHTKRSRVVCHPPATSAPLDSRHLFDIESGAPVRVGARRRPAGGISFNVAPPDQQLARLSPRCMIGLRGLLAGHYVHSVALAEVHPQVFWRSAERPDSRPIPMVCDTLWIDTDRAIATLTYRGYIDADPASRGAHLVVAAGLDGPPPTWPDVAARLHAARWLKASEDLRLPTETMVLEEGGTVVMSGQVTIEGAQAAEAPLPFRDEAPSPPPPAALGPHAAQGETISTEAPPAPSQPAPSQPAPSQPAPNQQVTLDIDDPHVAAALRAPTPFGSQRRPWAPRPPDPVAATHDAPETPRPAKGASEAVTGETPPTEKELPIDVYAAVKVAILAGDGPLEAILREHGIDEVRWRIEERRRARELSQAAASGDLSQVRALRRAMREARRKSG